MGVDNNRSALVVINHAYLRQIRSKMCDLFQGLKGESVVWLIEANLAQLMMTLELMESVVDEWTALEDIETALMLIDELIYEMFELVDLRLVVELLKEIFDNFKRMEVLNK